MWYVVQTQSGDEELVTELFEHMADKSIYNKLFIPMFEDVYKRDGHARIRLRRLFPGYFFVSTDRADEVFNTLKNIPEFTRLLGVGGEDDDKVFLPISEDDAAFLASLMENGLMRVSYVSRGKSGRIDRIIGPLAGYANRVVKFDISRRRAIVRIDIFGKERKLKFGLWTDDDPRLPWIDRALESDKSIKAKLLLNGNSDIGIYPNDRVVDETGVYTDQIFIVRAVNPELRLIYTTIDLFGTTVNIQLNADEVRKI